LGIDLAEHNTSCNIYLGSEDGPRENEKRAMGRPLGKIAQRIIVSSKNYDFTAVALVIYTEAKRKGIKHHARNLHQQTKNVLDQKNSPTESLLTIYERSHLRLGMFPPILCSCRRL
jgi:hypothetical protein